MWQLDRGEFSALFTGDIGTNQEELLRQRGLLEEIDVLKAAHHGSKNSSCESFLQDTSPELTIISCGKDNLYGHPHAETLERLESARSDVRLTWEQGQITVTDAGGEYIAEYFSEE